MYTCTCAHDRELLAPFGDFSRSRSRLEITRQVVCTRARARKRSCICLKTFLCYVHACALARPPLCVCVCACVIGRGLPKDNQ